MLETYALSDETSIDSLSVSRRSLCPSVLHIHRFGMRLFKLGSSMNFTRYGQRLASMPRLSTHALSFSFRWCTLPRQCFPLRARIHVKGPWLVLGDFYTDFSTMNHLKNMVYTLPPTTMHFRLLKACQIV